MKALDKYEVRVDEVDSLLCVGLDSNINRLPAEFNSVEFPQLDFNRHIIDQTAGYASAFKFNMAFYETTGAAGWQQLKNSLDYLRGHHPGALSICDAKRGDIGNSSAAYARAIFDELGFDAVTLNPYLGRDALQPFLDYKDKACIILCRSSNAGSGELQNLHVSGRPLWQAVAETIVDAWNANGNCMLVAGATFPEEMAAIRAIAGDMTLLAPGVGAQGGDIGPVLRAGLNSRGKGLIISASRSVIFAKDPAAAAKATRDEINRSRS